MRKRMQSVTSTTVAPADNTIVRCERYRSSRDDDTAGEDEYPMRISVFSEMTTSIDDLKGEFDGP